MPEESHGPKKLLDNHICREGILTGIFNSGEVEEKHFPLSFHMPTVVTQERRKYSAGERGTNEIKTPGKTKGDSAKHSGGTGQVHGMLTDLEEKRCPPLVGPTPALLKCGPLGRKNEDRGEKSQVHQGTCHSAQRSSGFCLLRTGDPGRPRARWHHCLR